MGPLSSPVPLTLIWLPFGPLIRAIRGIALGRAPITHYGQQILIGLG